MKKLLAFTLAETLIVIGIIGVVSALTLPNLNSSTGEKEKLAKVKKIQQNLEDAFGRAVVVYGPFEEWASLDSTSEAKMTRFGTRVTEFMKVSKTCGVSGTGCFKSGKFYYLGGNTAEKDAYGYKVILADGTSVSFETSWITFDIDGPNKGKHQYGEDIFMFAVSDDGRSIVGPFDRASADNQTFAKLLGCSKQGDGTWASSWILKYDNMDYKKINSSGKCTNGTTPTEENPRCS